jgi:predicted TPR repeat methyltransferase
MDVQEAYDQWAEQYDTNQNKTRDLEAISLRESLKGERFENALEIGCGTGKNTEWLLQICDRILSVDLSIEMLAKAKEKLATDRVSFQQADINKDWDFAKGKYDLVVFSLVLEHINDLKPVFHRTHKLLNKGGKVYIGNCIRSSNTMDQKQDLKRITVFRSLPVSTIISPISQQRQ